MKFQAGKMLQVHHAVSCASHASNVSSATIDTRGFDEALVIINAGTAGATASLTGFVMESPSTTAASFAHIAGSSFTAITPTAGTLASEIGRIALDTRKRYLRVKLATATANGVEASANVILLAAKVLPVTASVTVKFSI